jgi:hypothetical protein
MTYKAIKCPRLDSNQHAVASTTTSKWLVYQFQHLGSLEKRIDATITFPDWAANVFIFSKQHEKLFLFLTLNFLLQGCPHGIAPQCVWIG